MHVWSKRARWYFYDEEEYPSNARVDLDQALGFFRDRPGNEAGTSLGDLLGPPVEQEEGWWRLELASRRPAEQDDEDMVRGWHGTAFESINSILRDGFRESTGESGTRVLVRNGRPVTGVYFHREEQRYKALGYAELVPLWRNGVFFQVAVEILVGSESASKVPSSDQWVAQAGGIQVVALWLRGLTKKDLPYGVPVREAWLPSCETRPDAVTLPRRTGTVVVQIPVPESLVPVRPKRRPRPKVHGVAPASGPEDLAAVHPKEILRARGPVASVPPAAAASRPVRTSRKEVGRRGAVVPSYPVSSSSSDSTDPDMPEAEVIGSVLDPVVPVAVVDLEDDVQLEPADLAPALSSFWDLSDFRGNQD